MKGSTVLVRQTKIKSNNITAVCWQGTEAQRPENPSSIANISKGLTSSSGNIIATDLPERSWENHDKSVGQNKYSCNYGFQQRYSADLLIDTVHESYIVQGSNSNGPISTQEYLTSAPSSESLQTAADNTETDNTPFEHFPTGQTGGKIKDPYQRWRQLY